MARQSPHRPDADKPELELDESAEAAEAAELDELDDEEVDEDAVDEDTVDEDADPPEASAGDQSLWADARIDPVEIALPAGVGYTLRAYRLSTSLTPTEVGDRDDEDPFAAKAKHAIPEDDEDTVVILDDDFPDEEDDEDDTEEIARRGKHARADSDEPSAEEFEDEEEEAEEVPVFLSHRGRLLLFKSAESLVTFVRSGAPNDLAQVDGWPDVVERVQPADIAPADEDSYELDLVVENLRGGHDTWDVNLLIEAGEAARDLAYALRLQPILTSLSPGSPLDELDEALRAAAGGGVGGFRGRRRLKKIGAQQASLGWRTIIGKISAAVDWRD